MTRFTDVYEWGHRLAETPLGVPEKSPRGLWEARGWKEFVSHMQEHKRPIAAIMLENCRAKFGNYSKFGGFPFVPGADAAKAAANVRTS